MAQLRIERSEAAQSNADDAHLFGRAMRARLWRAARLIVARALVGHRVRNNCFDELVQGLRERAAGAGVFLERDLLSRRAP
jgi:hypothetical protein